MHMIGLRRMYKLPDYSALVQYRKVRLAGMDDSPRLKALKRTTYLLLCAGFQPRHRGYRYLREAVWLAWKEPEMLNAVTKRLYPEVARRFETTDKQVERAIRNAIETAWVKGNPDTLAAIFGDLFTDSNVRPTNSEIIKILVSNIS